jgi:hypothetical protein
MFNTIVGAGAVGAGALRLRIRLRLKDAAPCGSGSATLIGILCANDRSLLVSGKEQQHSKLALLSSRSPHWRSGFQYIVRKLALQQNAATHSGSD